MATISKYFEINLDSKITKPLKDKTLVCFDTDSIMIKAIITEDLDEKDIEETQVSVIYDYGSYKVEQRMEDGGIELVGKSEIDIVPKSNCLMEATAVSISINIYDEDEFITIQPFIFRILKSSESEIMDEAKDIVNNTVILREQVDTLEDRVEIINTDITDKTAMVQKQIDEFSVVLENEIESMHELININIEDTRNNVYDEIKSMHELINTNIDDTRNNAYDEIESMHKLINTNIEDARNNVYNEIESMHELINTNIQDTRNITNELNSLVNEEIGITRAEISNLRQDAIDDIIDLTERVNNTSIELDECFLRSTPLSPMDYDGKLLFSTGKILGSPLNLIGKTYIMNVTGSPSNLNTISTNLSLLYFTLESGNVVVNYALLANKSIQGKTITITPQFDNEKNSIDKSAEEFSIKIVTNLLTSCVENARCTISSNTTLDNDL